MRRSRLVVLVSVLLLAACAPAAATPAQPAQPAQPARPAGPVNTAPAEQAAPAAPRPTVQATSAQPGLRPPNSGGPISLPTLGPAITPITNLPNINAERWIPYRDVNYGFAFSYPPDWTFTTIAAPPAGVLKRISVTRLNQSAGNNAEIMIDVRKSSGDVLKWVQSNLRNGVAVVPNSLEVGVNQLDYNAKLNGRSAIWVYGNSGTDEVAWLYAADQTYDYAVYYHADLPANKDNRAVYLQLLATLTLSGTTTANLALPQTAFITR